MLLYHVRIDDDADDIAVPGLRSVMSCRAVQNVYYVKFDCEKDQSGRRLINVNFVQLRGPLYLHVAHVLYIMDCRRQLHAS